MDRDAFPTIFTGAVAIVFTAIVWMAMTSSWIFRPTMGLGNEHAVIATVVQPIFWLMAISIVHERAQKWLTGRRLGNPSPWLALFDVVTSFLPVAAAVVAIAYLWVTKPAAGYVGWFLMLQSIYGMIIFVAIRNDILPTIRHYRS